MSDSEKEWAAFDRLLTSSRRDFIKQLGGAGFLATLAAAGGLTAFLEACAGSSSQNNNGGVVRGGHFVWANSFDTTGFNSLLPIEVRNSMLVKLMFDPLLTPGPNNTVIPVLAESLPEISSDGLTYTFKVHPNAKWTDGTPVTADDVVFTFTAMSSPDYAAAGFPYYGEASQYIQSVTKKDNKTVVIQLKKFLASWLAFYCSFFAIMPNHILGKLAPRDLPTADFNSNPTVNSGMFKFVKWDKGQQITMTRNEDYYRGPVPIKTFITKIVPDTVALASQLGTGEVDFAQVDPSQASTVQGFSNVQTINIPQATMVEMYLQLNPAKPAGKLFGDKNVRQAIVHAIDRKKIVESIWFGLGDTTDSILPTSIWAYNQSTPYLEFDKAKAASMLDAAGWTMGSGGVRQKNGVPFSFVLMPESGNKPFENTATAIQGYLKDVGINVTVKSATDAKLIDIWVNTRDFDAFINTFNYPPEPALAALFSSSSTGPGGINVMDYKNPQVDQLIDKAAGTVDQAQRKTIYDQIQVILAEDQPCPTLFAQKGLYGVSKRVQGLKFDFSHFLSARWAADISVSDGK